MSTRCCLLILSLTCSTRSWWASQPTNLPLPNATRGQNSVQLYKMLSAPKGRISTFLGRPWAWKDCGWRTSFAAWVPFHGDSQYPWNNCKSVATKTWWRWHWGPNWGLLAWPIPSRARNSTPSNTYQKPFPHWCMYLDGADPSIPHICLFFLHNRNLRCGYFTLESG